MTEKCAKREYEIDEKIEAMKREIIEEYIEKENPIWQEALNFIEEAIEKGSDKDWERLVEHNEGEIKEFIESLSHHDPKDFFKYAKEEGKTWDDYREE